MYLVEARLELSSGVLILGREAVVGGARGHVLDVGQLGDGLALLHGGLEDGVERRRRGGAVIEPAAALSGLGAPVARVAHRDAHAPRRAHRAGLGRRQPGRHL